MRKRLTKPTRRQEITFPPLAALRQALAVASPANRFDVLATPRVDWLFLFLLERLREFRRLEHHVVGHPRIACSF